MLLRDSLWLGALGPPFVIDDTARATTTTHVEAVVGLISDLAHGAAIARGGS